MAKLRVVTWNINSIRLRLPLLKQLAAQWQPDVIALQETKCPDDCLPGADLNAMGYKHLFFAGMKSYNGVIFLSKLPLTDGVIHPRVAKTDCRHIETAIEVAGRRIVLHNLYIPAGGDIPDVTENEKFAHKLDFVREMTEWFKKKHKKTEHMIALGDFNIAPMEHDVWSHKQLLTVVSHTPQEVALLNKMQASLDWCDVARHVTPAAEKLYSWWSYRNQDWRKSDRGRRLDHIWVTQSLVPHIKKFQIDKDARDWPQPSDHVPVVLDLAF